MQYLIATITFLILDGLWLGIIAKQLYLKEFGSMLRLANGGMDPIWSAAVVVYIALIGGIVWFVLPKANGQLLPALMWGGIFGFVTYATYDFTNLAVMANWPVRICIIDTLWGMVICGLTAFITVALTR